MVAINENVMSIAKDMKTFVHGYGRPEVDPDQLALGPEESEIVKTSLRELVDEINKQQEERGEAVRIQLKEESYRDLVVEEILEEQDLPTQRPDLFDTEEGKDGPERP
jgi:hypothetical protein